MSRFTDLSDPGIGERALERLRTLVELESPSDDEVRLRAVAGEMVSALTAVGAAVDTEDVTGVGEHVVATVPGSEPGLEPVVVLGHLDTVHPVGTFDPVFRVEDGRVYGPGVFDMKGGWACMLEALAMLRAAEARPRRPVILVATCDEETGSETSRDLIEATARGARAVLVPEPSLSGGAAKTRRKGVGMYRLDIRGRAAHAGVDPENGVSALVELAHQSLALLDLADPAAGTTISIGQAGGGTASNVIPAEAWAVIDVRSPTRAEAERVDRGIRSLHPVLDGAELEVTGGINRPPVERTEASAALYEHARNLASELGWELGEGGTGGGSDGSFTAGLGIPTLDGLGPAGLGAHTAHEHVLLEDLPRRVGLYGRLLETL